MLLVSHTNAAVDQALLNIGRALGERAEDGRVLRVGDPKDLRLMERPRLLAATHIRERAEELDRAETELRVERESAQMRTHKLEGLIALAEWLTIARSDMTRLQRDATEENELAQIHERLAEQVVRAEQSESAWRERAVAAQAVREEIAREATLATAVRNAQSRLTTANAEVEVSTERVSEAEVLLEQTRSANFMTRRLRGLPSPEEQTVSVREHSAVLDSNRATRERTEHEVGKLSQQLGQVRDTLVAFSARHGDSPDHVLAETDRLAQELIDHRRAATEAQRTLSDHRSELDTALARPWGLLQQESLVADPPAPVQERIDELTAGFERAVTKLGELSAASLQAEINQLTERMRAIDRRLQVIAEEKAAIEEAVIADARIVATTLTRAYLRDSIQKRRFDTVILDEASMAPIPALWIAAAVADHSVVVVGDFRRLPPMKHSEHPLAEKWLGRDVFDASGVRAANDAGQPPDHLQALTTQYRMHPDISAIPNELIYDGLLSDAESTLDDSELDGWFDRNWGPDAPIVLVDTEPLNAWVTGVGGAGRTSRLNFLSATVCADLAERMLLQDRAGLEDGSPRRILIAAPYRPHARLVELLLRDLDIEREVVAGTAHTFQGSEAPVVIFDLVNDEPHWRVGLFAPEFDETTRRLLNVALTRPKHRLVIVGDFRYVGQRAKNAFLGRLIRLLESRYAKVDARELVAAAARAAQAQLKAAGGPIERDVERLVVTQDDFYALLSRDLAAAEQRVVLYSPFITANRLGQLEPQLKATVERGVRVYVVTKTTEERADGDQATYAELEDTLSSWGIEVLHKRQMHKSLSSSTKRLSGPAP